MNVVVQLEEVYKLQGVPSYTYVEPVEFSRLFVALRTPGRGVVVEGPSGVGKTTAVTKAVEALGGDHLMLRARRSEDRELVSQLPSMGAIGTVIIDDFHRLDDGVKADIADYLKLLADEEDPSSKIVIVGINRAGESLLNFARDLRGRIEVIRFEKNSLDKLEKLVAEGADALNIDLPASQIALNSVGSFHLAQTLSYEACLINEVHERQQQKRSVQVPIASVKERVQDAVSMAFMDTALKFAAGPNFSKSGRAPYLHMLKWLGQSGDWAISLPREMRRNPHEEASVGAVLSGGHLEDFLERNEDLKELLHFDPRTRVLAVEDAKFFFFLRNLEWSRFAERVGFVDMSFSSRYDFALSFAAPQRPFAQALAEELVALELAVFYDKNEQARILASDLEAYLAPIYASEATYVVCILGDQYPERVWTRFESVHFRSRFGAESVIPAWSAGQAPTLMDPMREIGAHVIDPSKPVKEEARAFALLLAEKISEYRQESRPPLKSFLCRNCNLIHPYSRRAPSPVSLCLDCAEEIVRGGDDERMSARRWLSASKGGAA